MEQPLHTSIWAVIQSVRIPLFALLVLAIVGYSIWQNRRSQKKQEARDEHDREQAMNKDIRRAAQVEAMQARYAELAQRKAAEAAEQARLRKLQDAEDQARAAALGRVTSSKPSRGGDFNPLMGSGPVGGFKSERNRPKRGG